VKTALTIERGRVQRKPIEKVAEMVDAERKQMEVEFAAERKKMQMEFDKKLLEKETTELTMMESMKKAMAELQAGIDKSAK
jgi:hypothetical protein